MAGKHKHVDPTADYANTNLVRTSAWNDLHNSSPSLVAVWGLGPGVIWNAMPAALTPILGDAWLAQHHGADFRYCSQIMVVGNFPVRGASGSEIRLQYSLDGVTWDYPGMTANSPRIPMSTVGAYSSDWVDLKPASKVFPVRLRWVGISGNGSMSPQIGLLFAYSR